MAINDYFPLYHTTLETFEAVKMYKDPTFSYHRSMSQLFAEIMRRLSDSVVIPFKTHDYAVRLLEIYEYVESMVETKLIRKDLSQPLGERIALLIVLL